MTSETVERITLPVEGHLQVVELVQKLDLGKHGVASGVARFCEAADKENEPLLIEIIDVLVVSHVGAPAVSTHFEAPGHPDALLATILGGPYGGPDGPDGPQFAKFRSASDFDALCVPEYTAVLLSGVVRGVVYVAADNKWQPGMRRALDVSVLSGKERIGEFFDPRQLDQSPTYYPVCVDPSGGWTRELFHCSINDLRITPAAFDRLANARHWRTDWLTSPPPDPRPPKDIQRAAANDAEALRQTVLDGLQGVSNAVTEQLKSVVTAAQKSAEVARETAQRAEATRAEATRAAAAEELRAATSAAEALAARAQEPDPSPPKDTNRAAAKADKLTKDMREAVVAAWENAKGIQADLSSRAPGASVPALCEQPNIDALRCLPDLLVAVCACGANAHAMEKARTKALGTGQHLPPLLDYADQLHRAGRISIAGVAKFVAAAKGHPKGAETLRQAIGAARKVK